MAIYEYRCVECRNEIATRFYLDSEVQWGHTPDLDPEILEEAQCGPIKRRWSFGIAWPMNERGH